MFNNPRVLSIGLALNVIGCATVSAQNDAEMLPLKEMSSVQKCAVFKNSVCSMDLHPDNQRVVTADSNGKVEIYNLNTNKMLIELPHVDGVPSVVFSDDGKYVATGSYDSIVRVWSTESGSLLREFKGHKQIVFGLAFSSNSRMLASAGADDTAIVWNIESGEHQVYANHEGDVWGLTFTPDSQYLLTGGEDNLINIWDLESRQVVKTLNEHSGAVLSIEFSNDGKFMATGGDDYTVKLWNTDSWSVVKTLEDDSYSIYDLQFSPDDKWLVSGGRDKGLFGEFMQYHLQSRSKKNDVSARVWDVETGNVIQRLSGHKNDVDNIRFTADGRTLLSSGVDGRVVTYSINR